MKRVAVYLVMLITNNKTKGNKMEVKQRKTVEMKLNNNDSVTVKEGISSNHLDFYGNSDANGALKRIDCYFYLSGTDYVSDDVVSTINNTTDEPLECDLTTTDDRVTLTIGNSSFIVKVNGKGLKVNCPTVE